MAVLHRPALLIADEPTSALDVITQSEILALFARLNRELNMAILYISHDLLTIAGLCHRVAILHAGEIVECNRTEQIFRKPMHPYTRRLIASKRSQKRMGNAGGPAVGSADLHSDEARAPPVRFIAYILASALVSSCSASLPSSG